MPRAIWSGAISFGLVTIPVKLFNGVSRKSVRFNQLDSRTGSRIKRRWVSAADGEEVSNSDLVRGFEISSGNFVTISDEELESLDPPQSRSIDIQEFVDLDDIDPMIYDNAYYLAPDELAAKAYRVLADALEEANKVAVAKMVMRTKQYVATIRPMNGTLVLSTIVYADEVYAVEDIDGLDVVDSVEIRQPEIDMAKALIESLSVDEFDHEKFRDEHRERVLDMIQRKSDGEVTVIEAPVVKDDGKVVDLMAALEASVAAAKEARGRHPSSSEDLAEAAEEAADEVATADDEPKPAAKKSTAKKSTSKAKSSKTAAKPAAKKTTRKSTAKKPTRKSA